MKKKHRRSHRKTSPLPKTAQCSPELKREPPSQAVDLMDCSVSKLVPYDETLLERARTQWQLGDWDSLATIDRDTLQHHPDRATVALLAAAGHLQIGQEFEARQYLRLAQDWGVSKRLISQILIAGVHNNIGRASSIANQQHRALHHFECAIAIGTPRDDAKPHTPARIQNQLSRVSQAVHDVSTHPWSTNTCTKATLEKEEIAVAAQQSSESGIEEVQGSLRSLEELIDLQRRQFSIDELRLIDARAVLVNDLLKAQKSRRIFLDCGGHDGCSAIKFLLTHPDFEAVSFEPNPALWDYYVDLPTYLCKSAVGIEDGVVKFFVDSIDADGSSLLSEKQIDITGARSNNEFPTLAVSCINLPELIRTLRSHYDTIVLKLDVEGMEYSILERMKADETLALIDELYCEFHWMKMGYPESQHIELVDVLRRVVQLSDWDALEFAIHGRKSGTLKKIRATLIQSFIAKSSQIKAKT